MLLGHFSHSVARVFCEYELLVGKKEWSKSGSMEYVCLFIFLHISYNYTWSCTCFLFILMSFFSLDGGGTPCNTDGPLTGRGKYGFPDWRYLSIPESSNYIF